MNIFISDNAFRDEVSGDFASRSEILAASGVNLDAMNISVVLGTIAGDDTVFIVMRDTNAAAAFCGEIKSLLD